MSLYPKCPQCGGHRLLAPAECFCEVSVQEDDKVLAKRDEPLDVTLTGGKLKCSNCAARFTLSEART